MPPTSIRLSAAQEAELAALVIALPLRDPHVAAMVRGGALTPGAVLRLAVARGLEVLRRLLGQRPALQAAAGPRRSMARRRLARET